MRRTSIIFLLASLALLYPAFNKSSASESWGSGYFSSRFDYRWADRSDGGKASDLDFLNTLSLDIPQTGIEGVDFEGLLWYGADLDGSLESDPFYDSLDTFSRRDDFRLYRAAFIYGKPWENIWVKAGRMDVWSAEAATIDGLFVGDQFTRWASMELFSGRLVSQHDSPDRKGVFGGKLSLDPWQNGQFKIEDFYHIENSLKASFLQKIASMGMLRTFVYMVADDINEEVVSLDLVPWTNGRLYLEYARNSALGDGDSFIYDYTSKNDYSVKNLNFSDRRPYVDYVLELGHLFNAFFRVDARYMRRMLRYPDDEDIYNVDFHEMSMGFHLMERPWDGFSLDAEFSRWAEDRRRNDLSEDHLLGYEINWVKDFGTYSLGGSFYKNHYDSYGVPRDSKGLALWTKAEISAASLIEIRYEAETDDLYDDDGFGRLNSLVVKVERRF